MNSSSSDRATQKAPQRGGTRRGRAARTCVGCREAVFAREEAVRLVIGPDDQLAVDLRGSAFGRGAWVHPRIECLAHAPRGLSRSFRRNVRTSGDEVAELVRSSAARRAEALVLAARRSGSLALGSDAVREALNAGRARLVVVATDARAAATTPWVEQAVAEGIARAWSTKDRLGALLGRAELGVMAVAQLGIAQALSHTLDLVHLPPVATAGKQRTTVSEAR